MYIEKKLINGKEYYYLKLSLRKNGIVKTKTVAYLGKTPMTKKQIQQKINEIPREKISTAKQGLEYRFENNLHQFLTKEQIIQIDTIKKSFQGKLTKLDRQLLEDMFRDFKTVYIYNTTAIEGNTLTQEETNLLLNENLTPKGKDLKEIYDHINEKEVFDEIQKSPPKITIETIISIHAKLLKNIDIRIGSFRQHNVRVFGAEFKTSDAAYIATDMRLLLRWHNSNKSKLHPLALAALFHEKFERIHPFYDGNGRTGRMLLNAMLLKAGLPPLVIKNSERKEYYEVLSKGHKADLFSTQEEHYQEIVQFMYGKLLETYNKIFSKWG